jgi:hypothetical protein
MVCRPACPFCSTRENRREAVAGLDHDDDEGVMNTEPEFPCTCTITAAGACERDLACPVCDDAAEEARAERGEQLGRDWFLPPAAAEYARELGRTAARATLAKDYSRPAGLPVGAGRAVDHQGAAVSRLVRGLVLGPAGRHRATGMTRTGAPPGDSMPSPRRASPAAAAGPRHNRPTNRKHPRTWAGTQ